MVVVEEHKTNPPFSRLGIMIGGLFAWWNLRTDESDDR